MEKRRILVVLLVFIVVFNCDVREGLEFFVGIFKFFVFFWFLFIFFSVFWGGRWGYGFF